MSNPIVNLENLTEPLTKLIDVVGTGIGTLYAPFGTVLQAKADARAKIILAKADAEVLSLQQRAKHRMEFIETRRQANLERIAVEASLALPSVVSGEKVDEDWVIHFFENAQDVTNNEMQKLWGRLLASEVASPNSFSRRTLQFLKTMDKREAAAFEQFCGFAFHDSQGRYFVFDGDITRQEMARMFNNLDYANHFADIGLVTPGMHTVSSMNNETVSYFERTFIARTPPKPADGRPDYVYDRSSFTQSGQELRQIVNTKPVPGYVELISNYLDSKLRIILRSSTSNTE